MLLMSPFLAIWDAVYSDKAKLKKAQEETKKFAQANTIKILADGLDPEGPPVLFILGLWRTYRCACASHRLA